MLFENEILEAIVGMTAGFALWLTITYIVARVDDWWKEMS